MLIIVTTKKKNLKKKNPQTEKLNKTNKKKKSTPTLKNWGERAEGWGEEEKGRRRSGRGRDLTEPRVSPADRSARTELQRFPSPSPWLRLEIVRTPYGPCPFPLCDFMLKVFLFRFKWNFFFSPPFLPNPDMGKHTSAGAALAQHGMSERASQRRQPSPPPPRSLPRTRKTRTGLRAGLARAAAPLPALPAARRDGGRGPRGSPAPSGVPPVCAPGVAACAELRTRGGRSERGVEASPDGRSGSPNAAGAGRGGERDCPRCLGAEGAAGGAAPRWPVRREGGEGPPCAPAVPEQMDRSNFRGPRAAPQPRVPCTAAASCSEGRDTFARGTEKLDLFWIFFAPQPPAPWRFILYVQTVIKFNLKFCSGSIFAFVHIVQLSANANGHLHWWCFYIQNRFQYVLCTYLQFNRSWSKSESHFRSHNCFPKQYNFQYAQDTHENVVTQTPKYVIWVTCSKWKAATDLHFWTRTVWSFFYNYLNTSGTLV